MEGQKDMAIVLIGGYSLKCGFVDRLAGIQNIPENETLIGATCRETDIQTTQGPVHLQIWDTPE